MKHLCCRGFLPVLGVKITCIQCILVIFQYRPMSMSIVQPYQWKALAETFWTIQLDGQSLSWKLTKIRTTHSLFKIDLCSASSMKSSRRNFFNPMNKYREIKRAKIKQGRTFFTPRYTYVQPYNSKRSRQELSTDVGLSWKIITTRRTPFYFHTQNRKGHPKTGVSFLLW